LDSIPLFSYIVKLHIEVHLFYLV